MTALGVLSLCAACGVKLVLENGDRITLEGPQTARDEVRETIRAVKPEVLTLLRGQRQTEVSAAFAEAFGRLSNMYNDNLTGSLWARIVDQHPTLARSIDTAEAACDLAALSYQSGEAPDSSAFVACLAEWEGRWREAIEAITGDTCSDCHVHAVVLVSTDYGSKFCRACLRPGPIASPPKGRAHA